MNLTVLIVEQLDWGAQLKTLTFRPGRDFWVAPLDEYRDQRSGPFHILEPENEHKFARKFMRAQSRMTGRYEDLADGRARFRTEWRGIPTEATSVSSYALYLPEDAVPDLIEFTDPRAAGRLYRYRAVYDDQKHRIACYLDCRSSYGAFDFDLTVEFHRDADACRNFSPVSDGQYEPSPVDYDGMVGMAGGRWKEQRIVQQFFDNSKSVQVLDHGLAIDNATVQGPVITGEVSGTVGAIGNHARSGSVQSSHGNIVAKAKASTLAKISGLIALVATALATVLLIVNVTNVGIAGYIVAVISALVAIIPLFRQG